MAAAWIRGGDHRRHQDSALRRAADPHRYRQPAQRLRDEELAPDSGEALKHPIVRHFIGSKLAVDHVARAASNKSIRISIGLREPRYIGQSSRAQSNGRGFAPPHGIRSTRSSDPSRRRVASAADAEAADAATRGAISASGSRTKRRWCSRGWGNVTPARLLLPS